MSNKCPRCEKVVSRGKENQYRPFCSKRCKLIDFGTWANEENVISRPLKSEDFYEDESKFQITTSSSHLTR